MTAKQVTRLAQLTPRGESEAVAAQGRETINSANYSKFKNMRYTCPVQSTSRSPATPTHLPRKAKAVPFQEGSAPPASRCCSNLQRT